MKTFRRILWVLSNLALLGSGMLFGWAGHPVAGFLTCLGSLTVLRFLDAWRGQERVNDLLGEMAGVQLENHRLRLQLIERISDDFRPEDGDRPTAN